MKSFLVIITALLSLQVTNAQWWGSSEKVKGNGNVITADRVTEDYDGVSVAGSFDVELVAGSEGKLTIKAEENLIPHLETEVVGGILKINPEKGYNLVPSRGNKIFITVPVEEISKVSLAGSGDVVSKTTLKSKNLKASLAGSGDIKLMLDATNVEGSIAGSGDIQLEGTTTNFECSIAGSGDVDAYGLKAENVEVSIAGSGNAKVYCDGNLKASLVGSGDLIYKGNPKKEDSKALGSGDIRKAG
ncbi:head GIN domain-containing protein [Robertkochia solimangrovi]|uniref:head GIN domain-containing protein n=1 Tax=Robertkochia solimangrovi TaxID=2213046 RepID=UPI00117C2A39|nr:head GIN domain-containing protein [Robertkochia solimangrovi]TRZ43485.1 DUF2807 domain-containing protein [Robertkochia solimangrovi]